MEIGKEEIRLRKGVDTYLREGSFGGTEKNVQVMMEWEREYMYACVDSLNLSGKDDVLEIGFGMGCSASRIQSKRPKSHTIVECDRAIIKDIENWKRSVKAENVVVIESTWQDFLSSSRSDKSYDCVFFDDFPISIENKQNDRLRLAAEMLGSRWHVFISMVCSRLSDRARITGYMAEMIKWNRKDITLNFQSFPVVIPDHCVYAKGKSNMYVPLFRKNVVENSTGIDKFGPVKNNNNQRPVKKRRRRFLKKVLRQLGMEE